MLLTKQPSEISSRNLETEMTTTYQLVIEVETDGEVDLDQLEAHCLTMLRGSNRIPMSSTLLKFNTVVFETSYPTANPWSYNMKIGREHLTELLKELSVQPEEVLKEYDSAFEEFGSARIAYRYAMIVAAGAIAREESWFRR